MSMLLYGIGMCEQAGTLPEFFLQNWDVLQGKSRTAPVRISGREPLIV